MKSIWKLHFTAFFCHVWNMHMAQITTDWMQLYKFQCRARTSRIRRPPCPLRLIFSDISRCFETTLKRQYLLFVQTFIIIIISMFYHEVHCIILLISEINNSCYIPNTVPAQIERRRSNFRLGFFGEDFTK